MNSIEEHLITELERQSDAVPTLHGDFDRVRRSGRRRLFARRAGAATAAAFAIALALGPISLLGDGRTQLDAAQGSGVPGTSSGDPTAVSTTTPIPDQVIPAQSDGQTPASGVALIGVGDGLPDGTEYLRVPALDEDHPDGFGVLSQIANGDYINVADMSDSMQAIQATGLAGVETRPISYMFDVHQPGYTWEEGRFDAPELGASISVGQQYYPADVPRENVLAAAEVPSGIWVITSEVRDERIQIIAYSSDIGREVNVVFGPRSIGDEGLVGPVGIGLDEALKIVSGILDAIAQPAS